MKREHKRPSSFRAIAWRVTALTLALWLLSMTMLTWAVAKDFYRQLYDETQWYASSGSDRIQRDTDYPEELPGDFEVDMIDCLGYPYYWLNTDQLLPIVLPQTPNSYSSDDWIWGKWDLLYGYEAAVTYHDENGEILMQSGSYLTFVYTDEASWQAQNTEAQGFGYVNLDAVEGGADAFEHLLSDYPTGDFAISMFISVMRLNGYFEGAEFHPVSIDRGNYYSPQGSTDDIPSLCRLDSRGIVEWTNILSARDAPDQALETIYVWDLSGIRSDYGPVTVNGVHFETLTDLLAADLDPQLSYSRESLLDSVIIWRARHEDVRGEYTLSIAVRCWPLGYAMLRLLPTYLVSLAVLALCVWLILRKIRRSLTIPLETILGSLYPSVPASPWREPYLLEKEMADTRQSLAEARTELQQLRTALDYAKDAEENRRQLVSNLTHELKTPLAVIHSYAEGLQSGIARDKQAHYLQVILEEVEKMDAMVLQMLDLSRLEAGKVRLSEDRFCLLALTKSIAEKLAPAAESRGLHIYYGYEWECPVLADESRISQVITNLLSNAIRYTGDGGSIWIKIFASKGFAHFYIENTSPHLPQEVLDKLFDSFYRADPSRSEKGTGLGLAIARSIVELHRGQISVRNTTVNAQPCLEFHFSIPIA